MLHQVLTSFMLMGVCLTVLLMVIMPKPALIAEAIPRPSHTPMPRALWTIDACLRSTNKSLLIGGTTKEAHPDCAVAGTARPNRDVLC